VPCSASNWGALALLEYPRFSARKKSGFRSIIRSGLCNPGNTKIDAKWASLLRALDSLEESGTTSWSSISALKALDDRNFQDMVFALKKEVLEYPTAVTLLVRSQDLPEDKPY
jgi:hypothetical protein